MNNKYLQIIMNGFDEDTDKQMIDKINNIADSDDIAEICNMLVVFAELHPEVSQALWDRYSSLHR
jgi:hypothetical protein